MTDEQLISDLQASLDGLKNFQLATVEHLFSRYKAGQQRLLCADEVGLGKTLIARGLLAKIMLDRLREDKATPLRVAYICSNQVLGHTNLKKLKPARSLTVGHGVSRLTYLAWEPEQCEQPLELMSLTPSTSFYVTAGAGTADERQIIYQCLSRYADFAAREHFLAILLQGGVEDPDRWRSRLHSGEHARALRPDLAGEFRKLLKEEKLSPEDNPNVYQYFPTRHQRSLWSAVAELCRGPLFHKNPKDDVKLLGWRLTALLRNQLISACTQYVDADFFVLDEFQRFRDLVDGDSDIAQRVIHNPNAKLLLLSATPTRPYRTAAEVGGDDSSHADFNNLLATLFDNPALAYRYEQHRCALSRTLNQLQSAQFANGELQTGSKHRDGVEHLLQKVMCRTERASVAQSTELMMRDRSIAILPGKLEIGGYVDTDRIIRAIDDATPHHRIYLNPLEYCKSAPYPLSFMHGYKVRQLCDGGLDRTAEDNEQSLLAAELRKAILQGKRAWLPADSVDSYRFQPCSVEGHSRLREFLQTALADEGELLLWIPPSLPYFSLDGCFAGEKKRGYSKTLVFSNWALVPRMLATLTSYELERRTIGRYKRGDSNDPIRYDLVKPDSSADEIGDGKQRSGRRQPAPEIRFSKHSSLRDATLLYPSTTLAQLWRPGQWVGYSGAELLDSLAAAITDRLSRLTRYVDPEQATVDRDWYALAPVLLDIDAGEDIEPLCDDHALQALSPFNKRSGDDEEQAPERNHKLARFLALTHCDRTPLGPMPDDLAQHLARLALGGPANIALRAIEPYRERLSSERPRYAAITIADALINLYNKPESICAIRQGVGKAWLDAGFREQILTYAIDGCLQAVLDEYLFSLENELGIDEALQYVASAISIRTSNVRVDFPNAEGRIVSSNMRCHYAMEFGTQPVNSEAGQDRLLGLREIFNSPFRPFVLASTSIGQEGLDFHRWCRRIVHWNLPSNPVDLEQREGRVNRYMSLSIRQQLAARYGGEALAKADQDNVWERLCELAEQDSVGDSADHGGLVPFWHLDENDFPIERIVAEPRFSREEARHRDLKQSRMLYRLTFGQPRPADMLEHIQQLELNNKQLQQLRERLMVNLSPWFHRKARKLRTA